MKLLWYYLLLINIITWIFYGIDKWKAKRGKRRIPERVLIILALVGGSAGAAIGMMMFRHKTRKTKFVLLIPVFFVLHCLLVGFLLFGI